MISTKFIPINYLLTGKDKFPIRIWGVLRSVFGIHSFFDPRILDLEYSIVTRIPVLIAYNFKQFHSSLKLLIRSIERSFKNILRAPGSNQYRTQIIPFLMAYVQYNTRECWDLEPYFCPKLCQNVFFLCGSGWRKKILLECCQTLPVQFSQGKEKACFKSQPSVPAVIPYSTSSGISGLTRLSYYYQYQYLPTFYLPKRWNYDDKIFEKLKLELHKKSTGSSIGWVDF
jgi:hypothetical protein